MPVSRSRIGLQAVRFTRQSGVDEVPIILLIPERTTIGTFLVPRTEHRHMLIKPNIQGTLLEVREQGLRFAAIGHPRNPLITDSFPRIDIVCPPAPMSVVHIITESHPITVGNPLFFDNDAPHPPCPLDQNGPDAAPRKRGAHNKKTRPEGRGGNSSFFAL